VNPEASATGIGIEGVQALLLYSSKRGIESLRYCGLEVFYSVDSARKED
jgi:hypothetical protein